VIITDGRNQDDNGPTLDQLINNLNKIADPNRPVQVIFIGIGTEVSEADLTRITGATGGEVFVAADPGQIGDIFLRALALRSGN
jgi:Ca-activated chloride channel family protein